MVKTKARNTLRKKRHLRIRKRLVGTPSKPRISIFRSNKHIYAQIIDDVNGVTLVSASTKEQDITNGGNKDAATTVGTLLGERAKAKNITTTVFDRSGYLYHGRVKALADAARAAGLEF
jgi:large subunit ribosomal protein L18